MTAWLTAAEVAELHHWTPEELRAQVAQGRFPAPNHFTV